jgi:hypothetical protein
MKHHAKKFGGMNTLIIVIAVIVVLFLLFGKKFTSGYASVETNISDAQFGDFFSRMTSLGPELKCNPGSADKDGKIQSSYYTGGLLPGGYCDDQEVVKSAMDYKLVGGDAVLGD